MSAHRARAERVAEGMREFGYPDVTADMVIEVIDAIREGREVPHGIVGRVIESLATGGC